MCCCGQPVILAGDFNADPIVIPALWPKVSRMVNGLIWSVLLPFVEVFLLPLLVSFSLMRIKALVGIFFLHVL